MVFGNRPFGGLEQPENQFAARRFARGNPVHVGKTRVAGVMVDVDESPALRDAFAHGAQPLEAGGIGRNHAIKFLARLGPLKPAVRIEERVFARHGILVPANDLLALRLERERQPQLRPNAIAVRPHMTHDADGVALAENFQDAVNYFETVNHARMPPREECPGVMRAGAIIPSWQARTFRFRK